MLHRTVPGHSLSLDPSVEPHHWRHWLAVVKLSYSRLRTGLQCHVIWTVEYTSQPNNWFIMSSQCTVIVWNHLQSVQYSGDRRENGDRSNCKAGKLSCYFADTNWRRHNVNSKTVHSALHLRITVSKIYDWMSDIDNDYCTFLKCTSEINVKFQIQH